MVAERIRFSLVICLLIVSLVSGLKQVPGRVLAVDKRENFQSNTFTPGPISAPPQRGDFSNLQPITAANASNLAQLAQAGSGWLQGVKWLPGQATQNTFAIITELGVGLHESDTLQSRHFFALNWSSPNTTVAGIVYEANISPDGRLAANKSTDGKTKVWNLLDGALVATLDDPEKKFEILPQFFSSDGQLLITAAINADHDVYIWLWDTRTWQPVRKLTDHKTYGPFTLTPNNRWLTAYKAEVGKETVLIWDLTAENAPREIKLTQRGYAKALSPDGKLLFSIESTRPNLTLEEIEVATGTVRRTLDLQSESLWPITFSPDRKLLAGEDSGNVYLWDLQAGQLLRKVSTKHNKESKFNVVSLDFTQDGTKLLVGDNDQWVSIWDVGTGVLEKEARLAQTRSACARVSPSGKRITWFDDYRLIVWEWQSGLFRDGPDLTHGFGQRGCGTINFDFRHENRVTRVTGNALYTWDIAQKGYIVEPLAYDKYKLAPNCCSVLDISENGLWVALAVGDHAVALLNRTTGYYVVIYPPGFFYTGNGSSVHLSPDGQLIAVGIFIKDEYRTLIFDAQRQLVLNLPERTTPSFSPNGKTVLLNILDKGFQWVDVKARKTTRALPYGTLGFDDRLIGYNADMSMLAFKRGNRVMLLDANTQKVVAALQPRCGECIVTHVRFSPDGKLLILSLQGDAIQVWGVVPDRKPDTMPIADLPTPAPTLTALPTRTPRPLPTPTLQFTLTPTPPPFERSLFLTDPQMTGNDVLLTQRRLLALGYTEVGVPDGLFGRKTDAAVRHFQQLNGLEADGVIGPKTWARLFSGEAIGVAK